LRRKVIALTEVNNRANRKARLRAGVCSLRFTLRLAPILSHAIFLWVYRQAFALRGAEFNGARML
jgi:hypothetical protein